MDDDDNWVDEPDEPVTEIQKLPTFGPEREPTTRRPKGQKGGHDELAKVEPELATERPTS